MIEIEDEIETEIEIETEEEVVVEVKNDPGLNCLTND